MMQAYSFCILGKRACGLQLTKAAIRPYESTVLFLIMPQALSMHVAEWIVPIQRWGGKNHILKYSLCARSSLEWQKIRTAGTSGPRKTIPPPVIGQHFKNTSREFLPTGRGAELSCLPISDPVAFAKSRDFSRNQFSSDQPHLPVKDGFFVRQTTLDFIGQVVQKQSPDV